MSRRKQRKLWRPGPLVEIEWLDASSSCPDWAPVAVQVARILAAGGGPPMLSAGYLIHQDADVLILAQNANARMQHVADLMTVPRALVRAVRRRK